MAATNKSIVDGVVLGTSISTLYTAPANGAGTRVVAFTLTNDNAVPQTYDLHVVPDGGSADATNRLVKGAILAASEDEEPAAIQNHLVPPNGTIQALASAVSSIAVRGSGIEFT